MPTSNVIALGREWRLAPAAAGNMATVSRPIAHPMHDAAGSRRPGPVQLFGRRRRASQLCRSQGGKPLPDSLTFQGDASTPAEDPTAMIDRAERTLEAARAALQAKKERDANEQTGSWESSIPEPTLTGQHDPEAFGSGAGDFGSPMPPSESYTSQFGGQSGSPSRSGSSDMPVSSPPDWASSLFAEGGDLPDGSIWAEEPKLKPLASQQQAGMTMFADAELDTSVLDLLSQEDEDLAASKTAELPPLQSVLELTSAFMPPTRGMAEGGMQGATATAQALEDGVGTLSDGTKWEKKSGVETGELGYIKRWTTITGSSKAGKVEWEESWWEASDWSGMRELGAEKTGVSVDGSAWTESWTEHLSHMDGGEPKIERRAHKWARGAAGVEEWEESWGEVYHALGYTNKYADKWAKSGCDVWHEKWGEEYNGKGWCRKYTDKWAERLLADGRQEQWGDKWEEDFGSGQGGKKGETWSIDSAGNTFNRWWGEDHYGDGRVRKHGSSTGGEYWDNVEYMDTYYNPIPHFGFHHAWHHSPTLRGIPERSRDAKDGGSANSISPGFGAL